MRKVVAKSGFVLLVLVLLGVWLAAAADMPVRGVASGVTSPFTRFWGGLVERAGAGLSTVFGGGPRARIRELEVKVRELQLASEQAEELQRQNRDLRGYYGLPRRGGWRPLIAEVVSRDPVTWNRGFRISRGSHDGVVHGSVVLAGDYVIGRVTEVGPGSSFVTTVAAQGCRLGVRLEGSGATGILEGTGNGPWRDEPACIVDFLPKDVEAKPGDLVWTSGLGDTVPGGLIVGRVAVAGEGEAGPVTIVQGAHARCRVAPLASFERVSFVAVYCPERIARVEAAAP